jgi:hypothetical protein
MSTKHFLQAALLSGVGMLFATSAVSNGLLENNPWQFQTTTDKLNNSFVVDLIEKKKGGYFDGFNTIVTNTTNIGSQVNCSNGANATGNIATNGQAGLSAAASGSPNISAASAGNSDTTTAQSDGAGTGTPTQSGTQDNSGAIDSSVGSSSIDSGLGSVTNGDTSQALNNDQDNSGNQTAGVDSSTACNMAGGTVTGTVNLPPGSGALNNP